MIKKILAYPASVILWPVYGLLLLVFHPVQLVCQWIGGYPLRKKSVDVLNFFLIYSLTIMGARIRFRGFKGIPEGRPLIIVSNHQSFFDIAPIVWGFRRFHPKFVSKKELSQGIPSVSINLRLGGSALIDRKNPRQSIAEIARLGRHIEQKCYSASIFPEGTRSRSGSLRTFQHAGLAALLKKAPSALIVPLVIDGHDRMLKNGYFPLVFGERLNYIALSPVEPENADPKELAEMIRGRVSEELERLRATK